MTALGEHSGRQELSLGERLKAAGWLQGSFVRISDVNAFFTDRTFSEELYCLVVTQSCDLLHPDSDEEPYVECLIGYPLFAVDGNFTARKNPRRLHIEIIASGTPVAVEFRVSQLQRVDRQLFEGLSPDHSRFINPVDLKTVTDWLAARYARAAFPDAFNDRRVSCKEELKKAFKGAKDIGSLYIALSSFEELKPGDAYSFTLLAILKGSPPAGVDKARDQMQAVVSKAAAALSKCDGIEEQMKSCVLYESEITLNDVRRFVRFEDFDYVSIANPAQHATPADRL